MSYLNTLLAPKGKALKTSAAIRSLIGETNQAARKADERAADAWQRREILLLHGSDEEIRSVEAEASAAELEAERARAALPDLTAKLNVLRNAEQKAVLKERVAAISKTIAPCVAAYKQFTGPYAAFAEAYEAFTRDFPAEATAISMPPPFAIDLASIQGAHPTVQPPAGLWTWEEQTLRALQSLERKL